MKELKCLYPEFTIQEAYPEDEICAALEKEFGVQEVVLFLDSYRHGDVVEKLYEINSDLLENEVLEDKDLQWFSDCYNCFLETNTLYSIKDLNSEQTRTHPDFLKVVKEINDPERFKIVQIPANVQFHLMGDNAGCGPETIHENHRTWS
jgi:hypothetical protein